MHNKVKRIRQPMYTAIGISLAFLLQACVFNEVTLGTNGSILQKGDVCPTLQITCLDDRQLQVPQADGVQFVLFFHTECKDSRRMLSLLQLLYDEYSEYVHFIGLACGQQPETIAPFIQHNNYSFPVAADADGSIYATFAEQTIPRVYIIADGIVQRVYDNRNVFTYALGKKFIQQYLSCCN